MAVTTYICGICGYVYDGEDFLKKLTIIVAHYVIMEKMPSTKEALTMK